VLPQIDNNPEVSKISVVAEKSETSNTEGSTILKVLCDAKIRVYDCFADTGLEVQALNGEPGVLGQVCVVTQR
jgi:inosine/xanthosine triphosphate pyrophosphatase family protein